MVTRVRRHRREPRWWPQQTAPFRRPQPRPGRRRRLRAPQRTHCHSGSRTGRGAGSAGGRPGLAASRGDPDADRELSLSKMGTSGDRAIKAAAGIARRPAADTDRDQPLAGGYRSVKHDDPASHVSTKRASPRPFRSETHGGVVWRWTSGSALSCEPATEPVVRLVDGGFASIAGQNRNFPWRQAYPTRPCARRAPEPFPRFCSSPRRRKASQKPPQHPLAPRRRGRSATASLVTQKGNLGKPRGGGRKGMVAMGGLHYER